MRPKICFAAGAFLFAMCIVVRLAGQAGAPQAPTPALGNTGARGAARGGGNPTATFPAQQRAPGDPAVIARGNTLYGIHCRLCHGADLRGGDQGGPNLLRSALVLNDQAGELVLPVVREGRRNPGMSAMPPISLPDDDVKAIAEYLHSIIATSQGQGAPPRGPAVTLTILVGDAKAGQTYFAAKCSSCHSVTGDIAGIGSRIANARDLQNAWVGGTGGGGRGGRGGGGNQTTVTVTPSSGSKVEGRLGRIDEFLVIVNLEDGSSRSFRRDGDNPKVEIRDPRDAHRKLLPTYTDKDIHDVTAYLVTLK